MLNDLKAEKGYEWVAEACMSLHKARQARKITQDQLDWELTKISLEFVNDYRFKFSPDEPYQLKRFRDLKREDIARMTKEDHEQLKKNADIQAAMWNKEKSMIGAINSGNLMWLKTMKEHLEKNNHERLHEVQMLITEHEARLKGF